MSLGLRVPGGYGLKVTEPHKPGISQIPGFFIGRDVPAIYGCVTSGTASKFLRLSGDILYIDKLEVSLFPCDRLLGIFLSILK